MPIHMSGNGFHNPPTGPGLEPFTFGRKKSGVQFRMGFHQLFQPTFLAAFKIVAAQRDLRWAGNARLAGLPSVNLLFRRAQQTSQRRLRQVQFHPEKAKLLAIHMAAAEAGDGTGNRRVQLVDVPYGCGGAMRGLVMFDPPEQPNVIQAAIGIEPGIGIVLGRGHGVLPDVFGRPFHTYQYDRSVCSIQAEFDDIALRIDHARLAPATRFAPTPARAVQPEGIGAVQIRYRLNRTI